jgi:hypothetical protein
MSLFLEARASRTPLSPRRFGRSTRRRCRRPAARRARARRAARGVVRVTHLAGVHVAHVGLAVQLREGRGVSD